MLNIFSIADIVITYSMKIFDLLKSKSEKIKLNC